MGNVQCSLAGKPSLLKSKLQSRCAHLNENLSIWAQQICLVGYHTLVLCSHNMFIYIHLIHLLFLKSLYAGNTRERRLPHSRSQICTRLQQHCPLVAERAFSYFAIPCCWTPGRPQKEYPYFCNDSLWNKKKKNINCSSAIMIIR